MTRPVVRQDGLLATAVDGTRSGSSCPRCLPLDPQSWRRVQKSLPPVALLSPLFPPEYDVAASAEEPPGYQPEGLARLFEQVQHVFDSTAPLGFRLSRAHEGTETVTTPLGMNCHPCVR